MRIFLFSMMAVVAAQAAWGADIRIEARFLPEEHVIAGSQWVRWENAPGEAWFALLANLGRAPNPYLSPVVQDATYVAGFDPSWTEIDSVVWATPAGEAEVAYELLPAPPTVQTYSLDDVLLRVELPPGDGELRIDFRTRFPHVWGGEPGRLGDLYTWRFGWHPITFAPPAADPWPLILPAHDYELVLRLPSGWDAALPGEATREEDDAGISFTTRFGHPVRSVSLFFGPGDKLRWVRLPLEGLTVDAVALPGDEDQVRALATYVQEILDYYGDRYGPYPHDRLLLVEHPNEVGMALTADGAVYLPRWFFARQDLTAGGILSRYGRYILAHELAHLWWGIGIGVDLDAENWLSEGMAQYLAIRWYEEAFGAEGGNVFQFAQAGLGEGIAKFMLGFVNLREHLTELPYLGTAFQGFDEAVVKPTAEVRYGQVSGVRLYDKGYLVLRALAHLVGEDTFDKVLRKIHAAALGGTVTVADLQALLEEATGQDLAPFFSQWVYGDAQADYAVVGVTRGRAEGRHVAWVQLRRQGTGSMPVTVEARGAGGERAAQVWAGEEAETVLEFRTEFPVLEVVVDPGHHALDVDRLNNVWPRRFVVATEGNALPLDGYLVRPDVESGGVAISYLDRFGWAVYPQASAAGGWVRYGRDWEVQGWGAISDTLVGAFSVTRTLWATPPTGATSTYWEPVGDVTVTVARRPYLTLGLDLSWQEMIRRVHGGGLSFLALPGRGQRIAVAHSGLVGLAPHTYFGLTLSVGFADPGLPTELLFSLPELRALAVGPGSPLPRGERKAFVSGWLWLPPMRPSYSLGGAALVTEVRPRLYLSAGRVWDHDALPTMIPTYAEVGGELVVQVEAFGGLVAFTGVLGMVWPLPPTGTGILYFGIQAAQ
ncbi:MAG: hypothetical protein NUV94_02635 [Candidatus Acetothermia bacterium]|nr:hypothetical protein [Candidatus Acetothermia bacterium]